MSAPFSRLQLAAALLEYDNDPTNPDAPYRSAHESALFAHLRRNVRPSAVATQRRSTTQGVSLPSEGASGGGRESVLDGRRSRGSTFALRNPFGADDYYEEEEELEEENEREQEQAPEMDLTSWGLEAFISKDKSSKDKGKEKETNLHPLSSVSSHVPHQTSPVTGFTPRPRPTRSMSVGDFDHLIPSEDTRRKSIGSPLDLADLDASLSAPFQRHRAASFALDNNDFQAPSTSQNIPFPSKSIRSPSPPLEEDHRTYSTPSLKEDGGLRGRTASNGSMTSRFLEDDNPFALQPPSRSSKFDPKAAAHARTTSNASFGSRMLLENDGASVMTKQTGQNRYSTTMDLLRPKVLIMPSPLQPLSSDPQPEPDPIRDGFHLSTDGPPLPPGARSARDRKTSSVFLDAVPIASNSFTPNPRMNLSTSQMIFRNTLKVDGERDPAYADIDRDLPRATEEGQQVFLDPPPEDVIPVPAEDDYPPGRPAGKLYGKSLIDDLESRKAVMRSKQRVFKGDDRPSMMARGPVKRSSTLIDPATLSGERPPTQRKSSYLSDRSRPESMGPKPLLSFEGEKTPQGLPPVKLNPNAKMPNARTVFGVDTLWEKEMAKLKQIEAQEKLEAEERERREAMATNKKKKKKGKDRDAPTPYEQSELSDTRSPLPPPSPIISTSPPVLPAVSPAIHGPPPVVDDDSESEASDHGVQRPAAKKEVQGWYEDSSDEDGPLRTTGVGPRYRRSQASSGKPARSQIAKHAPDSDSEDDLPLSATMNRAAARLTHLKPDSDSEEENKPLSVLLRKSQSINSLLPKVDFDRVQPTGDDDEDDDKPLGLRASHIAPSSVAHSSIPGGGDDDDRPLAFHPEQQRRTQYQMMAQHQQQQQMLMQAQQMHNSMFFNPPMMGSQFFGPPMAPPMNPMMMQPPMQIPSPPPMQDPTKFGRVDRWRRDVAVEGE